MDQTSGLGIHDGILIEYSGQCSDIVIPEKVKGIASAVFRDFDALRSVLLPAGLETIDSRCFEGCTGLKTVMFPDSLKTIGKYAFSGCSSLVFYRLPAGLSTIGDHAFRDCSSLSSVEIPAGVKEIGIGAFAGCSGLTSIRIPGRETVIKAAFGAHPFNGCDRLRIYTPAGSSAERFGHDNGIPVVIISGHEPAAADDAKHSSGESGALSGTQAPQHAQNAPVRKKSSSSPAEKTSFVFSVPESAAADDDIKRSEETAKRDAEVKAAAEREKRAAAERERKAAAEKERKAAAEREKKAAAEKERKAAAEREKKAEAERERKAAAESRKQAAAERERQKAAEREKNAAERKRKAADRERKAAERKKRREESGKGPGKKKAAAAVIALILAAGIGAAVYFGGSRETSGEGSGQPPADDQYDYTLTLEDYINSNDAAKEQIIQSVEGTDVSVSVSGDTLIYTYDLSASNSMTPEIAESDEIREALAETLDSSDDKFMELCQGLEKDTGISGVSVKVIYQYGDEELLTRTYTSEGRQ